MQKVTVEPTYSECLHVIHTYMHVLLLLPYTYHLNGFSINILVDYLDDLMQETIHQCEEGTSQSPQHVPMPLCSGYERPDKASAVSRHRSRFNLQ